MPFVKKYRLDRMGTSFADFIRTRPVLAGATALLIAVAAGAASAASALCSSDPYRPGCVLPQDEPDRRTVRERLADPVPDLVERPDKQRATVSQPDYSLPGPPLFLDIQGPRALGR
jgi:hypothetical protein